MADRDFEKVRQAQAERNAQTASKKGSNAFDVASQRINGSTKASTTENFDTEVYGRTSLDKFSGYNTSISVADDDDDDDAEDGDDDSSRRLVGQYTATASQMNEFASGATQEDDVLQEREKASQIQSRQSDYHKRRFDRELSPTRADAFKTEGEQSDGASYRDVMSLRDLEKEEERVQKLIADKEKSGADNDTMEHTPTLKQEHSSDKENAAPRRKKRWDSSSVEEADGEKDATDGTDKSTGERKRKRRWDSSSKEETTDDQSVAGSDAKPKSRWDTMSEAGTTLEERPKKRSRWDKSATATEDNEAPASTTAPETSTQASRPATSLHTRSFGTDVSSRNAALSDADLDRMLPSEGYQILTPPPGYEPTRVAPSRVMQTPSSSAGYSGFMMQESEDPRSMGKQLPNEIPGVGDLQFFKSEDMKYFGKLVDGSDESTLSLDELKERKIMRLLLKIKNGSPPMRKTALRQMTDNCRQFGAGPCFDQILPMLMERNLEDQERHLLVKVIDRILYKLDDLVRPYVHKILVVIEPLLIDQDYYARVEGREIVSNLSKAAGLATMISTMRPDIDHMDEYVRNTTARAFAVVASALGIPALLPFLRAVCRSKKSWTARHTGVKIVQQIPILLGCAILPHLKGLVDCIGPNLDDEQPKVRTVTALAIAALAEAASPYGIESFDGILNPLWTGARRQRGKALTAYLKAVGYIIPLMDEEYANYYTSQIMEILLREFSSPDEEMKKVVLKVISQCVSVDGVTAGYIKDEILHDFFRSFWVRRMAIDTRNYHQVVDTTVDIGQKVGVAVILDRIVNNLKDESEAYRKMTLETLDKIIASLGSAEISPRSEEILIDGMLLVLQEQSTEDAMILNGFGTIVTSLGERCKPYLPQIVSTILWRLNNKNSSVRQQAADLISQIAPVIKQCEEEQLLTKLGTVLYEYLGEEYPEVLGSILKALGSVVRVVGMNQMKPPVSELLPRLTPILRNRQEKVQENVIDLVGRIADRGPQSIPAREWMRICFELLDMLKAHKKGIRRAANNTFGYIANAIGPSDVLSTLLNNLRVQERQSRVCTAVAIGIVAETCGPFTTIPYLLTEYRTRELNVQNGVLKALSFLTEYIGDMSRDYVYTLIPLLEDALIDRDQVHRQTAASVVKHLGLGLVGQNCEDGLIHLLNLIWPNIFETSPHVIDRIIEAIDAIRNGVGCGVVMAYTWNGLFHPARKVRTPYWRVYNNAYEQNADSIIPYYPNIQELHKRHELFITI